MPNYQAISLDCHAKQRWQRPASYAFAAQEAVIPLAAAELPKAAISLPIGFIEQDEGFVPVAVLGLQSGQNLYVAPNGFWAGHYIPAVVRSYPFRLVQAENERQVLCIDEDSGLISDGLVGERFFTEKGLPTKAILDILSFLKQIAQSWPATVAACAVLKKHKLIRPWQIILKTDAGDQQITGIFQIDESVLNLLSGEVLLEMQQAGALLIAYCQMLSMQHLPELGDLLEAHAKIAEQALAANRSAPVGDLDLEFLSKGGTINFSVTD